MMHLLKQVADSLNTMAPKCGDLHDLWVWQLDPRPTHHGGGALTMNLSIADGDMYGGVGYRIQNILL